jgi:hypothetical protein
MRSQHVMFLALLFVAGIMLSFTLGSLWFNTEDVAVANSMEVFTDTNIFGLFHVPIPNLHFISTGLKAITTMNFAFFTGGGTLIQFILVIVIGSGFLWGILSTVIYLGGSLLSKL